MRFNPLYPLNHSLFVVGAAALFLSLDPSPSCAAITISIQQVGANVVITGSGSAITTGLTTYATNQTLPVIVPTGPALTLGPTGGVLSTTYSGLTGPSTFGGGSLTNASSGTGDRFGLDAGSMGVLLLQVPVSYASGSALLGSATYNNTSLTTLGITPGTYVYSFGSGATADTLTIQAGAVTTTAPEPGSLAFLLPVMGAVGMVIRKRQSRKK